MDSPTPPGFGQLLGRATPQFKQPRAARTYQALLDAAARVFARSGFENAQTPEIAAEAGVSTGAFYRYFVDKRQIFVEMIANHLARAHTEVMAELTVEQVDSRDIRETIDVAIGVLFDHVRRNAALERELVVMSLRDPEVQRIRAEFDALGVASLAALIGETLPGGCGVDLQAAARVIYLSAVEVAADRAGLRPSIGAPLSEGAIRLALREMIYRFLYPAGEFTAEASEMLLVATAPPQSLEQVPQPARRARSKSPRRGGGRT